MTVPQEHEASMIVSAPGNYNPEDQLTPQRVDALKRLGKTAAGEKIESIIVANIVEELLVDGVLDLHDSEEIGYAVDPETEALLRNPRVVSLIGEAAYLGSHWQQLFERARELPGGEWPEYMTPPATLAEHLGNIEIVQHLDGLRRLNPDYDFSEQTSLFELASGESLDSLRDELHELTEGKN